MPKRNHKTKQIDDAAAFDARFSRYRRLLRFVATRALGGPERADEAVENCRRSASQNPPRFKYDGAFSSWLIRILIDEALVIRGTKTSTTGYIPLGLGRNVNYRQN